MQELLSRFRRKKIYKNDSGIKNIQFVASAKKMKNKIVRQDFVTGPLLGITSHACRYSIAISANT